MQVEHTAAERAQAAGNRRVSRAAYERRTGPRRSRARSGSAPASRWDPAAGLQAAPRGAVSVRSADAPGTLPSRDEDIASRA
jgi:hypothetical protein